MAEIVGQPDGLDQVLIDLEGTGHGPRNRRDLHRMGHARAVMIARAVQEDLGLVLESAERTAVDDAVTVALEFEAQPMAVFRVLATARGRARLGVGREVARLTLFQIKAAARHSSKLSSSCA